MFERDDEDPLLRRLAAEEGAVLDATELLCEILDRAGVTRAELARRLKVAPSEVTQRFQGRNLTIRSFAATLDALDHHLVIDAKPRAGASRGLPQFKLLEFKGLSASTKLRGGSHYNVPRIMPGGDSVATTG